MLEGIDLWVTGVVAEMPQTRVDGVRFTFDVENAERQDDKSAVVLAFEAVTVLAAIAVPLFT